jgi:YVTN family beta-propeller protein
VSAENGYNISVVDTKNHDVIATINLPRGEATAPIKPKGIAIAPDGKTVYVSTGRGNSVAVIDAATETLKTLIPVGQRPWGIALSTDGQKLYTANGLSNDVSVIDVTTNKVVQTIKAGAGPWGVAIVP